MKKILPLLSAISLVIILFTSCSSKDEKFKLGVGTKLVYSESQKDSVSCEATVATVILDKDGKIVNCRIDASNLKVNISDGLLQDGADKLTFASKYDLGDDYNMKQNGGAIAEWYEQADAFANYCKGKTADEVAAISINDQGKATNADLIASCTISIKDFIEAVVTACRDEQAREFSDNKVTLGVQLDSKVESAQDSTKNDGNVEFLISTAAVAVKADGKLAATVVDAAQPSFSYDDSGNVISSTYKGTKRAQKDSYGMVEYGGAIADWYKQSAAMCDYIKGLNPEEIKSVVSTDGKAKDADLLANCTISISNDINEVIKAMSKAK